MGKKQWGALICIAVVAVLYVGFRLLFIPLDSKEVGDMIKKSSPDFMTQEQVQKELNQEDSKEAYEELLQYINSQVSEPYEICSVGYRKIEGEYHYNIVLAMPLAEEDYGIKEKRNITCWNVPSSMIVDNQGEKTFYLEYGEGFAQQYACRLYEEMRDRGIQVKMYACYSPITEITEFKGISLAKGWKQALTMNFKEPVYNKLILYYPRDTDTDGIQNEIQENKSLWENCQVDEILIVCEDSSMRFDDFFCFSLENFLEELENNKKADDSDELRVLFTLNAKGEIVKT